MLISWPGERETLAQFNPELVTNIIQLFHNCTSSSEWYYTHGLATSLPGIHDQNIRECVGEVSEVIYEMKYFPEHGETDTTELRDQVYEAHQSLLKEIDFLRESGRATDRQLELLQEFKKIRAHIENNLYFILDYLETDPDCKWLRGGSR